MDNGKISIDGALVNNKNIEVNISSASIRYGISVFEAPKMFSLGSDIYIFRFQDYFNRLKTSCKFLELDLPLDSNKLLYDIKKFIEFVPWKESYALRINVFCPYESELLGEVECALTLSYLDIGIRSKSGVSSKVIKRSNLIRTSNNNLYMIKSPSHYINARKELYSDIEFDDILYVNEKENICELSRSNIFLIKDRTVYTPDLGSGILDGITRKLIIDLCQEHNILIEIKELNYSNLSDFDSAFCVGTTNGITPIRNIDKNIHFDTNNLLLAEIVNYYKEVFSKKGVEKYKEWFVKL